jgi:hypothetical protein
MAFFRRILQRFSPLPIPKMSILPRYYLGVAADSTAGPDPAAPTQLCLDLGIGGTGPVTGPGDTNETTHDDRTRARGAPAIPENPATSTKRGSFIYDRDPKKGGYGLEWGNLAEFEAWLRKEELDHTVQFNLARTANGSDIWTQRRTYKCARAPSGGPTGYEKKNDWHRKIDSKKTGCGSCVVIKIYPHTQTILGRYHEEHDHEIGLPNVPYTRLSHQAREQAKNMLGQKIERKEVVREQTLKMSGTTNPFLGTRYSKFRARGKPRSIHRVFRCQSLCTWDRTR